MVDNNNVNRDLITVLLAKTISNLEGTLFNKTKSTVDSVKFKDYYEFLRVLYNINTNIYETKCILQQ